MRSLVGFDLSRAVHLWLLFMDNFAFVDGRILGSPFHVWPGWVVLVWLLYIVISQFVDGWILGSPIFMCGSFERSLCSGPLSGPASNFAPQTFTGVWSYLL